MGGPASCSILFQFQTGTGEDTEESEGRRRVCWAHTLRLQHMDTFPNKDSRGTGPPEHLRDTKLLYVWPTSVLHLGRARPGRSVLFCPAERVYDNDCPAILTALWTNMKLLFGFTSTHRLCCSLPSLLSHLTTASRDNQISIHRHNYTLFFPPYAVS